jgi:hypothetical protein
MPAASGEFFEVPVDGCSSSDAGLPDSLVPLASSNL